MKGISALFSAAILVIVIISTAIVFYFAPSFSLFAASPTARLNQSVEIGSSGLKMNQNVEGNETFVENQGNKFWNFIDSIYWIIIGLGIVWIGVGIATIAEKIKNLFVKNSVKK